MKAEGRQTQRVNRFRRMQHAQNLRSYAMLGVHALSRVVLEKLPQKLSIIVPIIMPISVKSILHM